jgi:hypothetical protein
LGGLVVVPKIRFEGILFDLLEAGYFGVYVKDDLEGFESSFRGWKSYRALRSTR